MVRAESERTFGARQEPSRATGNSLARTAGREKRRPWKTAALSSGTWLGQAHVTPACRSVREYPRMPSLEHASAEDAR